MQNFKKSEFKCPCGCGLNFKDMSTEFVKKLDKARKFADTPFNITSSIRCLDHNEYVGGSKTSSHLKGLAVDLSCGSPPKRFKIIKGLILAGFNRIGVGEFFVHVDADKTKLKNVIWRYKNEI